MAAFESSGFTEKHVLKCSNIEISGVRCEMEQSYSLATLIIGNFYQLKNDVEYYKNLGDTDRRVSFIKRRHNHTIKITGDDLGNVSASISYERKKASNPFFADEVSCGEYIIVMPSSVVENEQNTFLTEGRLIIHIRYKESDGILKRSHACSGRRDKRSGESLVEDLFFCSTYPNKTHMILHVENQLIPVPKGLLACRSSYFKEFPEAGNYIYLLTYYDAVAVAVKYLYTGEIPNVEDLSGPQIYRLMEVASSLRIKSLESKCLALLNDLVIQGEVVNPSLNKCIS